MRKTFLNSKGFTYTEVVISLGLVVTVIALVIGLQARLGENQAFLLKTYLATETANSTVSQIGRELRTMRQSERGDFPLATTDDQELAFYSDVDFDGVTEKVRYFLEETELKRGVIDPSGDPVEYPAENERVKTVAEYVRNGSQPVFYYYNEDWPEDQVNNPLTTPTRLNETKLIKVFLQINLEEDQPERDFILETFVQLRSLKENL